MDAAQGGVDMLEMLNPAISAIHHEAAADPTECIAVMGQAFQSISWEAIANVPSYGAWWRAADDRPAYDYHRLVLQVLQSGGVRGRWTLKSPHHALALDALVDTYPDARLVLLHRDPVALVGSVCSLIRIMSSTFSDADHRAYIAAHWQDTLEESVRRIDDFRARRPEHPILDVAYADLARDPLGTARRRSTTALGLAPGVGALRRRSSATSSTHPRREFGSHSYDVGEFGLTEAEVRERFRGYTERYGVEPETLGQLASCSCEYSSPARPAASAGSSRSGWPTAATRSSGSTWCRSPTASTAPGTPPTAPTPTRWPTSSRPSSPSRASTRSCTWPATPARPRCPTRSPRTSSPRPRCSTRWSSTASAGSSTAAPTTRSATRRAPGCPTGCSRPTTRLRPDTFYGVAKASAEALMSLYADRHGLDVVSLPDRLVPARAADRPPPRHLALPRRLRADGRRRADHAGPRVRGPLRHLAQHPRPGGTSRPAGRWATTRMDDAEDWADRIEARPEDEAENAHVGGPFVAESMVRPALDRS